MSRSDITAEDIMINYIRFLLLQFFKISLEIVGTMIQNR